jgi:hypothetical protein
MTALAAVPAPQLGQPAIEDASAQDDDLQLWSVTTILKVLEKSGLIFWSAEETAKAALHFEATWRGMLADDDPNCLHRDSDCPALKWLAEARFRRPKGLRSANELGTDIHTAVEEYALTGVRPVVDDEVRPFLDQFDGWLQRFSPSYQAVEVTVYHPELGYAGTADAFLTIGGHGSPTLPGTDAIRYLGDYKSTRKARDSKGKPTSPYPEQDGLQLAAYRHAKYAAVWRPRRLEKFRRRYYLLGPDERAMAVPVPEVDTGLVIHITPEACEAFPIVCDESVFEAYLAVQDAARWVFQMSRTVMGDPLLPARGFVT